jgi:spermidine/putrescine transport system permease protein
MKMFSKIKPKTYFAIPYYGWYAIMFAVPFLFLLVSSFFSYSNYRISYSFSIHNYIDVFSSKVFYIGLWNSLQIGILVALITTVISFMGAYYIYTRVPAKYQKIAIIAIILPLLSNYLLRAYSWSLVLSNQGIINWLLLKIGIISEPIPLLFSKFAIILGLVSFLIPIATLLIYLGLTLIQKETIKTALDLGASEIKTIFKAILPQIKTFIYVVIFLSFIISMGDYVMPAILGGGNVYTYSYNIVDTININNYPKTSALGVILSTVILVLGYALFRGVKNEQN